MDDIVIVRPTDMPNINDIVIRHKARYLLAASFCRSQDIVLDFPCGSGYGSATFPTMFYEGRDNDEVSIEYAKQFYRGIFKTDDLTNPHIGERVYNLIACIEGLEHIEQIYQARLIKHFYDALIHGGTLVITTPERKEQITNPYHKWELTRPEFETLLQEQFKDVQLLCIKEENHKKEKTNFLYGICGKEA
jgi:2-polyprenyl-3-methyl-5-hydroxy-6-metoxy-1,4-benzoquinol methylase